MPQAGLQCGKRILLLDKDSSWTTTASEALIQDGCNVFSVDSLSSAMHMLRSDAFDLIVADINIGGGDPDFVIGQLCNVGAGADIIICTPTPSLSQAVRAGKLGLCDYLDRSDLRTTLVALRDHIQRTGGEGSPVPGTPTTSTAPLVSATGEKSFCGMLSQDQRMHVIFELIQTIATSSVNVLIEGETGTGKELVAHAIHTCSNRSAMPFVILDCSTLAHELLESELFGHEKGAFTGAAMQRIGRFERANRGTLFLDEVANINLPIQAKLLRVIESRTFERVGGQKTIAVDVRVVAASNRRLEECVAAGNFREDLFHRLHVVQILVPPLRQRPDDIPMLARHFVKRFAHEHGKTVHAITAAGLRCLTAYRWPGNVRELENVILQAVVLSRSNLIDVTDLPPRIWNSISANSHPLSTLANLLQGPEREILISTLKQVNGNVKQAADRLQISRTTLYAKLKHYDINIRPTHDAG
jgi:two-component system response regulator HydG